MLVIGKRFNGASYGNFISLAYFGFILEHARTRIRIHDRKLATSAREKSTWGMI